MNAIRGDVVSSRHVLIEALRQALADRAGEIEADRRPSDRELVMGLADEIAIYLRRRMRWRDISEVLREGGLRVSTATLKGYYRQAVRMRRGCAAVARSGRRGGAAASQSGCDAGVVQAPAVLTKPVSGHGRIMSEEC